jgi:hypothetical protein
MLTVRSGPFAALSAEAARSVISGSAPKRTSIHDIAAIAKAKTRVMHCSKVTSLFDYLVGAGEGCRQNRSSSGLNAKEAPPAGELTQQESSSMQLTETMTASAPRIALAREAYRGVSVSIKRSDMIGASTCKSAGDDDAG